MSKEKKRISKRWIGRAGAITAAATTTLLVTAGSAQAFGNLGAYAQLNCKRDNTLPSYDACGTVPSHSWDHWIQSRLDCTGAGTTKYKIVDADNGVVVDSGSCSAFGSTSWKYTVGLYGNYNVRVSGSFGTATIRNCTSSCTTYNQNP